MRLLVSIHDVTPAFASDVRTLWEMASSRGVMPALLVVPSWHGAWDVEKDSGFCDWLRERAAEGAEIFLHGERHDEVGTRRRWRDHARAWWRTAREGEFLTFSRGEASARIGRGLARLRGIGLDPIGFVPPAWLARPATFAAVGDHALRFTEDDREVVLLDRGMRLRAPVMRWSTRESWRAVASDVVARVACLRYTRESLVRVALHPSDLRSRRVVESVARTLDELLGRAAPTAYASI